MRTLHHVVPTRAILRFFSGLPLLLRNVAPCSAPACEIAIFLMAG
jgi:hypothetical protein